METLPLDTPPPGAPWHRASVILGHHIGATALLTCGWRGVPQVTLADQSATGGRTVTWYIAGRPGVPDLTQKKARQLILAARAPGPKGLAATHPQHPFFAALAALENLAALIHWQQTGGPFPALFRRGNSPFLSMMSDAPDLQPIAAPAATGFAVDDGNLAAALIACGFMPTVAINPDGQPVLMVPPASLTLPEFKFEDAILAAEHLGDGAKNRSLYERISTITAPLTLPGFPTEEHPFFYAFRACRNFVHHHQAIQKAAQDPIRFLKNPFNSQRTALVTASLTGSRGSDTLRRELEKHLRKTA